MKAKDYLGQAKKLDKLIANKNKLLNRLREQSQRITATPKEVAVMSSSNPDRLADTICKAIDLESKIREDLNKLADLKYEIINTIDQLKDPDMIDILYRRYIHFEEWEYIIPQIPLSPQSIYRLHGEALSLVQKIIDSPKKRE